MNNSNEKRHSFIYGFAGTAAAIAVVGGSAWGINYIAKNGGLKGPDVQGGAGYHEDVTEPAESEPEMTETAETEDTTAAPVSDNNEVYGKKYEAGDIYTLADGSTAAIDGIWYDGFIFKTQITVHSDDPDYWNQKPRYDAFGQEHIYTGIELDEETGVALSSESGDKGSDIIYTYFAVIPADGRSHTGRIWDTSANRDRTVGYIEYGGTEDDISGKTLTFHTESEEYGRRDVIISPYGFRMEQSGSDYYLKSLHHQLIIVRKSGQVRYSAYDSAGEDSKVDDLQLLFGAFSEPLDLDDIYSLTFCGETFVLDETAEPPETGTTE